VVTLCQGCQFSEYRKTTSRHPSPVGCIWPARRTQRTASRRTARHTATRRRQNLTPTSCTRIESRAISQLTEPDKLKGRDHHMRVLRVSQFAQSSQCRIKERWMRVVVLGAISEQFRNVVACVKCVQILAQHGESLLHAG